MNTINICDWSKVIKIISVSWILFYIIFGIFYGSFITTIQDQNMVQQTIIVKAIKQYIEKNKEIPKDLDDLLSFEYKTDREQYPLSDSVEYKNNDLKYYPKAWNQSGKILLQSRVYGSYIVTFGDGHQAVLTRWYNRETEDEPIVLIPHNGFMVIVLFFIPLIILLLLYLILSYFKREAKRKTGENKNGYIEPNSI